MLCSGRKEFTAYLPENTQAVVVQPIGGSALLVAASDTQRGFNKVDQVMDVQSYLKLMLQTCMLFSSAAIMWQLPHHSCCARRESLALFVEYAGMDSSHC